MIESIKSINETHFWPAFLSPTMLPACLLYYLLACFLITRLPVVVCLRHKVTCGLLLWEQPLLKNNFVQPYLHQPIGPHDEIYTVWCSLCVSLHGTPLSNEMQKLNLNQPGRSRRHQGRTHKDTRCCSFASTRHIDTFCRSVGEARERSEDTATPDGMWSSDGAALFLHLPDHQKWSLKVNMWSRIQSEPGHDLARGVL